MTSVVEIERFVPSWSNDQPWSEVYPPVGPSPGHTHTHVRYLFEQKETTWKEVTCQKKTAIRFVALWDDAATIPSKTLFLNTVVDVDGYRSKYTARGDAEDATRAEDAARAEGYDENGHFYQWDITSLEVTDCSMYPDLIGEKVFICKVDFSLVINRSLHVHKIIAQKHIARHMARCNADFARYNADFARYNADFAHCNADFARDGSKRVGEIRDDAFLYCTEETIVDGDEREFATNHALARRTYEQGIAPCVDDVLHGTADCTETMLFVLATHLLNRQAENNV